VNNVQPCDNVHICQQNTNMSNEDHAPPSEVKATSRLPRILSRAWGVLRNSVLAAVNPRFSTFTYALTLAIIVGLLTFGATVGITVSLMTQCSQSCGLRPVVWLDPEEAPKWYTPLQTALSVSYGTKQPLRDLMCMNDEAGGISYYQGFQLKYAKMPVAPAARPDFVHYAPGSYPTTLEYLTVSSTSWVSSKCSVLHTADCGRKEWAALYQGLLAIANVSRGLPAVWPTSAAYSNYTADAALQAVLDMDRNRPMTRADANSLLAGLKVPQRLARVPLECTNREEVPASCYMALNEGAAGGVEIFQVSCFMQARRDRHMADNLLYRQHGLHTAACLAAQPHAAALTTQGTTLRCLPSCAGAPRGKMLQHHAESNRSRGLGLWYHGGCKRPGRIQWHAVSGHSGRRDEVPPSPPPPPLWPRS
jgi:hypothetical protein